MDDKDDIDDIDYRLWTIMEDVKHGIVIKGGVIQKNQKNVSKVKMIGNVTSKCRKVLEVRI